MYVFLIKVKLVATVLPDMDYIYSSNFRRAVDTADGILAHHKERGNVIDGPTVEMVEILRERVRNFEKCT